MEFDRNNSCCFTGHRLEKLPWGDNERDAACISLKERIAASVEAVYVSGVTHYICGMATGCDMYFGEAVAELRRAHDEVTLEAAVPYDGQSNRWSAALKKRYNRLLSECDYVTVVSRDYTPDCMMKRNRYMVDNARVLIAAYNGSRGGTMNTMLYAMRSGVEIIEIDAK